MDVRCWRVDRRVRVGSTVVCALILRLWIEGSFTPILRRRVLYDFLIRQYCPVSSTYTHIGDRQPGDRLLPRRARPARARCGSYPASRPSGLRPYPPDRPRPRPRGHRRYRVQKLYRVPYEPADTRRGIVSCVLLSSLSFVLNTTYFGFRLAGDAPLTASRVSTLRSVTRRRIASTSTTLDWRGLISSQAVARPTTNTCNAVRTDDRTRRHA